MASDTKLTVSLVLNDASFTKQINQVNKDIKQIQSEFKNSSAGIDGFGKTLDGVKTKLSSLSSQFEAQGKKVELYKNELAKTSKTLDELVKSYNTQSTSLDKTKQKYDEVSETMGENSDEAKKLAKEVKELEKEKKSLENRITSTNSRLTSLSTNLNEAEAEFKELGTQVKSAKRDMDSFDADAIGMKFQNLSNNLDKASNKMSTIGRSFSDLSGIFTTLAVPTVAFGAYSIKVSKDFEAAMSKVEAASGATAEDMEKLTAKARELGATTSKSAADAADGLGYMGLAGWDTQEMLDGLEPLLRLSEAGALDLGLASSLATDSMGALKLEVKDMGEYLDIVSKASVASNTDIKDLLESFINTGATLSNLNVPLAESTAILGILGNNGTKGYEAGTKLNSILTRMTAQSSVAAKAWASIGVEVFDSTGKFRGMTTILEETKAKLADLTEEERQYFLKQAVGTDNVSDFSNLLAATGGELQNLTKDLQGSEGALMDIALTMQDNVQGKLYEVQSKIEELGIKFGEILLPILSNVLDKIGEVVDWFGALSPEMQESIVNTGLMAIGFAGVTKALGGIFNAGSTVLGIFSKVTGIFGKVGGAAATAEGATAALGAASGGLATKIGVLASAAAPWAAGIAAVGAVGYATYKVMQEDAVPAVDLFADQIVATSDMVQKKSTDMASSYETAMITISEETQKGVQAYIDLDNSVNDSLFGLYINSTTITEQTKNEVVAKFAQMSTSIQSQLATNSEQTKTILTDFFNDSTVLTDQFEQNILTMNDTYYAQQQFKTQQYEAQITAILQKAADENRALTTQEMNDIASIREQMRQSAVQSYSKTEEETQIILGRLASYDERITAEIASKHIAEAENMRLGAVDAATKECDERIRQIQFMRDESKVISAEQADQLIADAERQRDDAISAANTMKESVIKKVGEMNEDVLSDVDTVTGSLLSKWDKFKNWWNNIFKLDKKTVTVEEVVNTRYVEQSGVNSGGNRRNTDAIYGSGSNAVNDGSLIDTNSLATFSAPTSVVDAIEVPNTASYMNDTVNAISTVRSNSNNNDNMVEVLNKSLQETQKQNNLLMSLVTLMQQGQQVDVGLNVDGRQLAKSIAKYMKDEISAIDSRKARLGGIS